VGGGAGLSAAYDDDIPKASYPLAGPTGAPNAWYAAYGIGNHPQRTLTAYVLCASP
jgi:hypothetical protein